MDIPMDEIREKAENLAGRIEPTLREHPVLAVGAAFAAGLIIGRLGLLWRLASMGVVYGGRAFASNMLQSAIRTK
jgi:hypothetical protein